MVEAVAARPVSEARANSFIAQVYLIMALGLAVTGIISVIVAANEQLMFAIVTARPALAWGLFLIQIVIVVTLSAAVDRMPAGLAFLLFFVYAALTGLTISVIFLVYTRESIASVFWVTAGTFFISSLFGLVTKRDMSAAGGILMMLLIGWLVAWLFSFFFASSGFNWFLTFAGIAIFIGLTAWDGNRIKQIAAAYGDEVPAGLAVNGALALYLDFINLFLLLLRAANR